MGISFRTSMGKTSIDAGIGSRLPELLNFHSVMALEEKNITLGIF